MPRHLHLDFETFSEVNLKDVGAYRYAFDPSTEILCAAMSLDDDEPEVWCHWEQFPIYKGFDIDGSRYEKYWDALEDPNVLIYAHTAQFEMAICQALLWKTWGIKCPNLSRFRCTMSMARRAALPAKLEPLAIALDLEDKKDKRGKALINKFSKPQPAKGPSKKNPNGTSPYRIHPKDDPEAFAEFMNYCAQDVRAEKGVSHCLSFFDDDLNNSNYSLDAVINARGVPVNLDALHHAQSIIDEETEIVAAQFRKLTGFNFTQNEEVRKWCNIQGAELENLQAQTVEDFLDKYDPLEEFGPNGDRVVQALYLRASVAYASIKKIPTMLACAGPHDNRIRGMLNHHGATTGRWTNSLVQFQNMKRPTVKMSKLTEDAYREICNGISRAMLDACYGPPLEVISSCIRHFVQDING